MHHLWKPDDVPKLFMKPKTRLIESLLPISDQIIPKVSARREADSRTTPEAAS